MEDQMKVKAYAEDGSIIEYDVLFTFHCDELNKDYIALTDRKVDENGNANVIISYDNKDSEIFKMDIVTDPDELLMAKDILEEIETAENNGR